MNFERKLIPLLYVNQHSRGVVGRGAGTVAGVLKIAGIAMTIFAGITSNPKFSRRNKFGG